jgi:hypothetical protein
MTQPEVAPGARFLDEPTLRAAAVEIARFACNGSVGRVQGDPVFDAVTEGRDKWKGYSACGDLAHYVLRELGYRDERVLNRNDDGGRVPWQSGTNLSRLVFGAGAAFVWARGELRPRPGDILYLAPPEHVCVLERLDEASGTIATFDYGQWDHATNKPAGRGRTSPFAATPSVLRIGARVLRGWLDLARLPGLLAR